MKIKLHLPPKVGDWTFPYKKPPGTRAVQIDKIENGPTGELIAFLSDGTAMHVSRVVRGIKKDDVA